MSRRRLALVTVVVIAVAANAAVGSGAVHRLPYLLAGLTVAALLQTFWEDRIGPWLLASTGTLLVAMLASITYSVSVSEPPTTARASGPVDAEVATSSTLLTGDDVPAEVAGAVEERGPEDRLAMCTTALEQIADAVRAAGGDVAPAPATTTADATIERRLASCEVRLRAIAETLPE